jgi:hypothetical protein
MKLHSTIFCLIILASLCSNRTIAQDFRIKAGVNLASQNYKNVYYNRSYDQYQMINLGFHAGATTDFIINDRFSIESGILFSEKGEKYRTEFYDNGNSGENAKLIQTINLYYLDLPITGKVTFGHHKEKYFICAGPYVGLGLSGQVIEKTNITDRKNKFAVEWGKSQWFPCYKRFDFGGLISAGVVVHSFQINLFYEYGLINIVGNDVNGNKTNNQVGGLSIGYLLGNKKK